MKHLIIGTAGHIDHGKTTLIKALTGRNTDRLKEEQKRGISIELGFTFFDLPSGLRAGIIDVPGHEKFIKNMLAGVVGMDIVALVIAADEGMMPQSVEHLAIMELLGIENGIIVLTKTDTVDADWLDLVEEEVREDVVGTFLESANIIRVSSINGEGIEELKAEIDRLAEGIEEDRTEDIPRLPVDRAFSIAGFGTIVTGTLLSGTLKTGDEVQLYPSEKTTRIRSIQVHDLNVDEAGKGQRVALNLSGIKKEEAERGMMIAPIGSMVPTRLLDVKFKTIELPFSLSNRTRLRLYIGTSEVFCRMILLEREELESDTTCMVQLKLEEPVVARKGDRFILRLFSPMITVGGGEIIDANPAKKKRYDEEGLKLMEDMAIGDSETVTESIIREHSLDFPKNTDIAALRAMSINRINDEIEALEEEGRIVVVNHMRDTYTVHTKVLLDIRDAIIDELGRYHAKYPLRIGMSREEIRSKYFGKTNKKVGDLFIETITGQSKIESKNEYLKLEEFVIGYTPKQQEIKDKILSVYRIGTLSSPKVEEVFKDDRTPRPEFMEVLNSLTNSGELIKLDEDVLMRRETLDMAIKKVIEYLEDKGTITVSEARDLFDTNRKVSVALLEHMDKRGITKREDDLRRLV